MRSAILPFWPIIRHFFKNIWYLRFFLLLILLLLFASTAILVLAEGGQLAPGGTVGGQWSQAARITTGYVFFGSADSFTPFTFFGQIVRVFDALVGYVLLGIMIWVIEQSLSDHRPRRSIAMFIPSKEDF